MTELILRKERKQVRYFTEQLHGAVKELANLTPQELNLAPRESEVWNLRQAGYTYQQIAAELYITINTVKKHLKNIFVKHSQMLETEVVDLDMILVPAGTIWMGSPDDEPECSEDEEPQREVNISSFFMGRYPVTQAQWRFVAGLAQAKRALKLEPSNFKGNNRPVEQVSWYDAVECCDRLTQFTGRPYRLPSEAEWEYACRSGTTTPFYFGKTLTAKIANYNGIYTYNDGSKGEYREETTPVDQFEIANAFGLCDMHGNVWEWCEDHWHENYEGAPKDGRAWLSENEDAKRVRRGGSWYDAPRYCRSASRVYYAPVNRFNSIGFRVVCSAPRTL
ncbi:SUMF1/EgtB/PvdO family nonheme iron enzyme [Phormidium sp. FACHB-592]|uniref:SUMF1/EgtB/PvdO family nonheme iron enzyme n=1 Tax=Stenomitos frigidus AS-A4 TaxID=2933935 RepID=A0ABV0KR97_9CYAN|nr:SUMF1/EgtB/PvdO family nonheme iron enzyme [Phormidium sp. FACHB-592]MBD2073049.1 SUMF1/EgtB/PvdO family nonheme iron enzyme [Phormidium sp. FACHB-592]